MGGLFLGKPSLLSVSGHDSSPEMPSRDTESTSRASPTAHNRVPQLRRDEVHASQTSASVSAMSAVTNETDETDCVAVTEISVDKDEGGEITFEFNGKRLAVSVFSSHSSHSIEDRLVSLLVKATDDDFEDVYDDTMGEVVSVILDAGMAVFHRVAPALVSSPSSSGQVLHSLLYPETFRFRLEEHRR